MLKWLQAVGGCHHEEQLAQQYALRTLLSSFMSGKAKGGAEQAINLLMGQALPQSILLLLCS